MTDANCNDKSFLLASGVATSVGDAFHSFIAFFPLCNFFHHLPTPPANTIKLI